MPTSAYIMASGKSQEREFHLKNVGCEKAAAVIDSVGDVTDVSWKFYKHFPLDERTRKSFQNHLKDFISRTYGVPNKSIVEVDELLLTEECLRAEIRYDSRISGAEILKDGIHSADAVIPPVRHGIYYMQSNPLVRLRKRGGFEFEVVKYPYLSSEGRVHAAGSDIDQRISVELHVRQREALRNIYPRLVEVGVLEKKEVEQLWWHARSH